MPVYNAEQYVAAAVQSILDQTFRDFEFLIIDDGSTDRSLAILEQFSTEDQRVRLVSRPNTGYVVALNEMLEMARGEFIARMDADDISLPDRLTLQVKRFHQQSELVAVGMKVLLVDPANRPLCVMNAPLDHEGINDQLLRGLAAITHPSVMLRSSTVFQVGGYDSNFWPGEDSELFLRLAEVGQLANLPNVGLRYRVHGASVGHRHREAQVASARRAAEAACQRRGLPRPTCLAEAAPGTPDDRTAMWAWWALRDGHLWTARRYAFSALCARPSEFARLKLFLCALRGR